MLLFHWLKIHLYCKIKKQFSYRIKMWTEEIQDQTAHSVHSDLDLHCPQKLLMWSTAGKELLPDHGSRVFSFCCNVKSAIHVWILHHKSMMYSPCQAIKAFQNIVPNIGILSFPFFHGFFPFNPLPHNTALRYLAAENIVRNGEIACTYMVLRPKLKNCMFVLYLPSILVLGR